MTRRHSRMVVAGLAMLSVAATSPPAAPAAKVRQAERLDRGVVAVPAEGGGVLVSWRLLASDPAGAGFDVIRDGRKLNAAPVDTATAFVDKDGDGGGRYAVQSVKGRRSAAVPVWRQGYLSIPLDPPPGGRTPAGEAYTYTANDASAGDLDGDGRYEIVLKWDPTNAHDNSQGGYTGDVFVDAYTLDGKRLWRIDLGPNIRAGAHYTHFQVADYDGDGRAEVATKTADGTVDGTGAVPNKGPDWRERTGTVPQADRTGAQVLADGTRVAPLQGRILKGPEYLTVFDGRTGRALASAPYDPPRYPGGNPTFEQLQASWGDGLATASIGSWRERRISTGSTRA